MSSSLSSTQEILMQRRLSQKDQEIAQLQARVSSLSGQLEEALQSKSQQHASGGSHKKRLHPLSPHTVSVREIQSGHGYHHGAPPSGTSFNASSSIASHRTRLGRNASIATQRVLDDLHAQHAHRNGGNEDYNPPPPVQRILDMFQHPAQHMDYLNSETFAKDVLRLASKVKVLLEREPRVVFLESPCYVFGDIHGNLEDLHFFSDNLWRLGMSLTAGTFLFLGDYVDRGLSSLECIAYLFAMKYQMPNKLFLLRGNHETRDVNGWEEHYGERSFIYQCRARFGDDVGYRVWEACNQVFDRMPLSAVIDQDIFCVHGGIPRGVSAASSFSNSNNNSNPNPPAPATTRIQDILTVSRVAGINPPYQHEDDRYQQVASDCIWSDPASEEQELYVDADTGFGQSLRGGGAICFGNKAVTDFLCQHDLSYILRAHEAHAEGVAVSKQARVFTVFSTSKDHNQGAHAMAGCILVDQDKLQVINRSPAYKNQYVHRRDSMSVATLSAEEIAKRMQLGLVTQTSSSFHHGGDDDVAVAAVDEEEQQLQESWQDFDMEDDNDDEDIEGDSRLADMLADSGKGAAAAEQQANSSSTRRSSTIDLNLMRENQHDCEEMAGALDWMEQDVKRQRPSLASNSLGGRGREPSVSSIAEGNENEEGGNDNGNNSAGNGGHHNNNNEDEDVATVDGDQDVELRDADAADTV